MIPEAPRHSVRTLVSAGDTLWAGLYTVPGVVAELGEENMLCTSSAFDGRRVAIEQPERAGVRQLALRERNAERDRRRPVQLRELLERQRVHRGPSLRWADRNVCPTVR